MDEGERSHVSQEALASTLAVQPGDPKATTLSAWLHEVFSVVSGDAILMSWNWPSFLGKPVGVLSVQTLHHLPFCKSLGAFQLSSLFPFSSLHNFCLGVTGNFFPKIHLEADRNLMLVNIPLQQSMKAALTAEIIKPRMKSDMHKAEVLTSPKKLADTGLQAVAWLVFLPLSYIFIYFLRSSFLK